MKNRNILLLIVVGMCIPVFSASAKANQQVSDSIWFDQKADSLVASMTLEEKVLQVCNESPAIDRLGLPEYNWWNECLHGVARAGEATVFPEPIGMGAMFDKDIMFRIGTATSDEARAKHNYFKNKKEFGICQGLTFWSPNINIFRDPRWGRGMETYGEDPYLTGELGAGFIKGLQGDNPKYYKVIATAKHFAVHSGPEEGRHKFNSEASNRDFYLTYVPQFKKAVEEAHVYSIMCAYNTYNGKACCGDGFFDQLLRKHWGFKGYMVSDCGAIDDLYQKNTHQLVKTSSEAAAMGIRGGTDLCCGGTYKDLLYAVKDGIIGEDEINVSVKRLMLARLKLGLQSSITDVPYDTIPYSVVNCKKNQELALEAAHKSIVLLKNQNTLPLPQNVKKILVVGPNADATNVLLGNYNGFPNNPVTILEGIKNKMPHCDIEYLPGCSLAKGIPVLESIPSQFLSGVTVHIYNNPYCGGEPIKTFTLKDFNSKWIMEPEYDAIRKSNYSISMTSNISIPEAGDYRITGETYTGNLVYINDVEVKSSDQKLGLKKGSYKLELKYSKSDYDFPNMRIFWNRPNVDYEQEAIKAASKADYVICCMGISPSLEGEEMPIKIEGFNGGDRTNIQLPAQQTDLMKRLLEVNKKTILVLLNGSALAINWEDENLPAIVEAWYPGQAGGTAVADVLWGDYNPSGKLPITFYKSVDQISAFSDYKMEGKTYRYFTKDPLYKFGYGLSYTQFEFSNLTLKSNYSTDKPITFSVKVKNVGKVNGEEVAQVYVSFPNAKYLMPNISLQEFKHVYLKAGETKQIEFTLSKEQIALLNNNNQFQITPGDLIISVGGCQPDEKSIQSKEVVQKKIVLKGSVVDVN